jgi:hypothetical protein
MMQQKLPAIKGKKQNFLMFSILLHKVFFFYSAIIESFVEAKPTREVFDLRMMFGSSSDGDSNTGILQAARTPKGKRLNKKQRQLKANSPVMGCLTEAESHVQSFSSSSSEADFDISTLKDCQVNLIRLDTSLASPLIGTLSGVLLEAEYLR